MRLNRLLTLTAPLVLYAVPALAANSGTPIDAVATTMETVISGPIAMILILAGGAAAAVLFMLGRNLESAFHSLVSIAIGGIIVSGIVALANVLFPLAGALAR
jgi:TrbC/VIRB2 pilin